MTESSRVSLLPAQVELLAALLDEMGERTLLLDTVHGRLSIEIRPAEELRGDVGSSGYSETLIVSARAVGEFLTVHPCRSIPIVQPGSVFASGDLLGFIRIGTLMTPITYNAAGGRSFTLMQILAAEGALVSWGTALFKVSQR